MIEKGRIALVVLTMVVGAAACSGEDDKRSGAGSRKTEIPYGGPALPRVEGKPVWSAPSPGISAVLGYGNAVAMLSAQGNQVTVLDAVTGKTLQRHQLNVVDKPALLSGEPVRLLRDTVQGRPVAVVRFTEQIPASGMQGEHEQLTDLVLDTAGRQLWRPPPNGSGSRATWTTQRDVGPFDSGYAISHRNTQGPAKEGSWGITTFQAINGGNPIQVPSDYGDDEVHDVAGDKAVMTDDQVLEDGLRGVDLAQGGKVIWKVPRSSYLATVGPNVLIRVNKPEKSPGLGSTPDTRIQQIDLATGRVRTDVAESEINNGSRLDAMTYDPQTRAIIGFSGWRIVIIDGDTGRLRWRQDGPSPRQMSAVASAGGVTFMALEQQRGFGQAQTGPSGFLALDNRTGQVVADNLSVTALAVNDGFVVVEHGGSLYGFRLKAA